MLPLYSVTQIQHLEPIILQKTALYLTGFTKRGATVPEITGR
jgi:hypothetical protein